MGLVSPSRGVPVYVPALSGSHIIYHREMANIRFTYPGGCKAEFDLGGWLHTKTIHLSTCLPNGHPSTNGPSVDLLTTTNMLSLHQVSAIHATNVC